MGGDGTSQCGAGSLVARHIEEEFQSDHHAHGHESHGDQVRVVIPYPVPSWLSRSPLSSDPLNQPSHILGARLETLELARSTVRGSRHEAVRIS